jgi:predicted DNA-binding transcriptional regulator AlpA
MKLDTRPAAARLGLKPKTLENWRSQGIAPPFYRIGCRIRYEDSELDQWMAERRYAPEPRSEAAA